MIPIRKIMAAVDFSTYSKETVKYAAHLAEKCNAELVIVNVINQRDVDAVATVSFEFKNVSAENYLERQEMEREQRIQNLIQETGCGHLRLKTLIRAGSPFDGLNDIVQEEEIDLVVMGARGRGNLPGFFSGSIAEKMFRRCPVPVVSIRERK